jgi:hypothetical protein
VLEGVLIPPLAASARGLERVLRIDPVPNRLDDLMGEAANIQQLSPEIVIGYVVLVDEAGNSPRKGGPETWIDHFKSNLDRIAIRKAPLWNQGLLEAVWLVRIDSRKPAGQKVMDTHSADADGTNFFKALIDELYLREPTLRPGSAEPPTRRPAKARTPKLL